ncbi:MAG: ATP phosphoribosyltransferase regulatory subunit, partial [Alphaproteobacteria bacterium]
IAGVSGPRIDPPTLMPVEIILELSGEAVRSRLCTFTDAAGEELCLRPDFTTPIARQVASGDLPAARYHAFGPVYRLPPVGSDEAVEHLQIGFEWFGAKAAPEEDAEAAAVALEAASAGGVAQAIVRFGDVALFRAVVEALPFSPQWRARLRKSFSRRRGPRELLASAGAGEPETSPLAMRIAAMSEADATRVVEQMLAEMDVTPVGGRGPEQIIARLRDKAADRAPDAATSALLVRYLDLTAPAGDSVAALGAFMRSAGLDIGPALEIYRRRLQRLATLKPPFWADAAFSAEAGRRFDYYDGFVFELVRPTALDRPLVSGGRYDGLIGRLSGGVRNASAIGAALRVDRLAERAP